MTTHQRVLITGGSSGIGLGLARRFAERGAQVVVTGRSASRLEKVAADLPGVITIVGDLAQPGTREQLADSVGAIDMLINNAGVQRRVGLAADSAAWSARQEEIDLLLAAPVHLTSLLAPRMLQHERPGTIVNVTSGGAFVPQPFAPVYSAAKAALHSFTLTLRQALSGTPVTVVELIPPAVATGLAGLEHPHGANVDEFCDAALAGLDSGALEIGFGPTATPEFTARLQAERVRFEQGAQRFPVPTYQAPRAAAQTIPA